MKEDLIDSRLIVSLTLLSYFLMIILPSMLVLATELRYENVHVMQLYCFEIYLMWQDVTTYTELKVSNDRIFTVNKKVY